MSLVKIGLVQMSCTSDKQANIQKAIELIREAAGKGAQIVCLQELFASLYFCDVEDYDNFNLAESIPGPTSESLSKLAAELHVVIIASLFEKRTKDRKSTRLNSSHGYISYAVFCLKKKNFK